MSTSDWIQLGNLAVTFVVGAVIVLYTIETSRLRQEAQRQNDNATMPIVMLEAARDMPCNEDANMPSFKAVLRNLGRGAAFNIDVDPLNGPDTLIRFRHTTSLASGDRQPVLMTLRESGNEVHTTSYSSVQRMFHSHQMASQAQETIHYADLNGKRYRTILTFDYDNITKELISKLDKIESEPNS